MRRPRLFIVITAALFLLAAAVILSHQQRLHQKFKVSIMAGVIFRQPSFLSQLITGRLFRPRYKFPVLLTGSVLPGLPFSFKSADGKDTISGILTQTPAGSLHFKGDAQVNATTGSFDLTQRAGEGDFLPASYGGSPGINLFSVHVDPED